MERPARASSSSVSESLESGLEKLRILLNDISLSSNVTNPSDTTTTQDDSQSVMQKEPEKDETSPVKDGDEKSSTEGLLHDLVEVGEENETSTGSIGKLIGEFMGPRGKIIKMYDFMGLYSSSGEEKEVHCQTYQKPRISNETRDDVNQAPCPSSNMKRKVLGESSNSSLRLSPSPSLDGVIDLELRLSPPFAEKRSCSSSTTSDDVNQTPCPSPNKKQKFLGESSSSSLSFSPSPIHEERVVMASPNLQETNMVIAPPVLEEVNTVVAPPILEEIYSFMALPVLEENMIMAPPNPHQQQVLPDQDPWRVKKVLKRSDVDGSSRLLIGKDIVREHILPHVLRNNADFDAKQGTELAIWDVDTGTEYKLRFKMWITNSFIFNGGWTSDFVKRRNLMENDEIGLRWDDENSRLEFTVIHRNHQE